MTTTDLHSTAQRSWLRFLETSEPLRSQLYRYCRYLTRSPWDAEDLSQDALARAFVTLARMDKEPASPRVWLFRVASNLWIDEVRRRRELDSALVEVVGAATQYGPEAARRTVLTGMLFGSRRLAAADPTTGIDPRFTRGILPEVPRCEARLHRGRWLLVHWYKHTDGEAVRAFTTLELEGDRIARMQSHFYDPDFLIDLGGELGVPVRVNGYRWCEPDAS